MTTDSNKIVTAAGFIILMIFMLPWFSSWLWNVCLVPAVNGIHPVGYWQMVGITILANVLFKSTKSSS